MKPILAVLAACAAFITLAGASLALGDRATLTSPPEAVAEEFVRELQTGRYERARAALRADVARRWTAAGLRRAWAAHRGSCEVRDVTGEPLWRTRGRARASVLLTCAEGPVRALELPLSWSAGEWAIAGLHGLDATPDRRAPV